MGTSRLMKTLIKIFKLLRKSIFHFPACTTSKVSKIYSQMPSFSLLLLYQTSLWQGYLCSNYPLCIFYIILNLKSAPEKLVKVRKSGNIRQDQKTLMLSFALFLTASAGKSFQQERLGIRLCHQPILKFSQHFLIP